VCSSLDGAWFRPVLIFSVANMPSTKINATTMLNTARRLALSHGTAKRFRITMIPAPARKPFHTQASSRNGNLTTLPLINSFGSILPSHVHVSGRHAIAVKRVAREE
jgi:hypothetical protein